MTDDYDPEITDEQLRRMKNSKAIRMAVACDEVADALRFIRADEDMWDDLTKNVLSDSSRVSSRETVEEIVENAIREMERRAGLVRPIETEGDGDE